jgi:hypothetical protein
MKEHHGLKQVCDIREVDYRSMILENMDFLKGKPTSRMVRSMKREKITGWEL